MTASNFPLIKIYKYLSLAFVLILFALLAYGISTLSSDEISNENSKVEENSLLSSTKKDSEIENTHVVLLQENIYQHLRNNSMPFENTGYELEGSISIFRNLDESEREFPKAGDTILLKGRCLGVDSSGAVIMENLKLIK